MSADTPTPARLRVLAERLARSAAAARGPVPAESDLHALLAGRLAGIAYLAASASRELAEMAEQIEADAPEGER